MKNAKNPEPVSKSRVGHPRLERGKSPLRSHGLKPAARKNEPSRGLKSAARRKRGTAKLRILFTCVGRRVELLNAFRRAAERLDIALVVHGADSSRRAPAMHLVDRAHVVPPIHSGAYINELLALVEKHRVDMLIPLLDLELIPLSASAERFAELGCRAVISSERVVRICRDKMATYESLSSAGIDTPQTWTWKQVMERTSHRFPYYMKPRAGSAAQGNYIVRNEQELLAFGPRVEDPIVQEFVQGVEHTLDVYAGFDGVPRCAVPRRRLEVRSGEVSKAIVVKDPAIMSVGRRVAEALEDCRGVITVQCMVTPRKRIRVIEINPRFGGGAPLAIHAGADLPGWLMQEHLGRRVHIHPSGFRNDVAMLRYDESVFVERASQPLGLSERA